MAGDPLNGMGRKNITIDPKPWGEEFMIDAMDCVFMKLDTLVTRNLLIVSRQRKLCSALYKRKTQRVYFPIRLVRNTVFINPVYCTKWSPVYNLPIQLFSLPDIYTRVK